MARPDRLLALLRTLRDGRLHRAEDLSRALGVSQRTIYRDLDVLVASGVPVAGERGLGYKATAAATLPPLNLTGPEAAALRLALGALAEADEAGFGAAARSLLAKVEAVLPAGGEGLPAFATGHLALAARGFRHVAALRSAIRARQKLRLAGPWGERVVRPLSLDHWGRAWTLTAWCETTQGFAALGVDAIEEATALPQLFVEEPGRRLADLS